MALFRDHRAHMRTQCRIPLEIRRSVRGTAGACGATLYNVSEEGIYIETEQKFGTGERVHIHPIQQVPRASGCAHLYDATGVVQWSRPVRIGRRRMYGAGVLFHVREEIEEETGERRSVVYQCDLCGVTISLWDVRQQQDSAWLCPRCRGSFKRLPEAIGRTVVRYLIGNAL